MLLLTFFDSRIAGAWQRQDKLGWKWPEQIHETYPVAVFVSASYHLKEISPLWSSWKRKALSQNIFEITKRWRIFCAWTEKMVCLQVAPWAATITKESTAHVWHIEIETEGTRHPLALEPKNLAARACSQRNMPVIPRETYESQKGRHLIASGKYNNSWNHQPVLQICVIVQALRTWSPTESIWGCSSSEQSGHMPPYFFGGTYPNLWKGQNRMFTPGKSTPTIMNPHYYFMKSPFSVWKSCQKLMSIVIFYVYIYIWWY